jgi:hypothetical protein
LIAVVCGVEFICKSNDLGQCGGRENEWACEDGGGLRERAKGEGGYDAEVCARATDGPEEVRIEGGRAGEVEVGCEDDFGGEEDVFCELVE